MTTSAAPRAKGRASSHRSLPARRRAALLAAAACLASIASNVTAQDAETGKVKALPCMGCHAIESYTNVYPTYYVPRVGGQHEAYLVAALQAYKNGQRKHPTMTAQASTLSEQDMKDIAAYWSSISTK